MLFKMYMEIEFSDLQILFDPHSVENSTKTRYIIFRVINFIVFHKYTLILNTMPATSSKKSWNCGNKKTGKVVKKKWLMCSCPNLFGTCFSHQIQNECIFTNNNKCNHFVFVLHSIECGLISFANDFILLFLLFYTMQLFCNWL